MRRGVIVGRGKRGVERLGIWVIGELVWEWRATYMRQGSIWDSVWVCGI